MKANMPNPQKCKNKWGDYKEISRIGKGAFGEVYKCTKSSNNANAPKLFVLKLTSIDVFNKYPDEYNILEKCDHANIVKLIEEKHFLTKNHHVMVMEYCKRTLKQMISLVPEEKYINAQWVFSLMIDICSGLNYLRTVKAVHNDIKPENILIRKENDKGVKKYVAVIADLGFGMFIGEDDKYSLYKSPECKGSIPYMSPQLLAREKHTYMSDIFSLGVTLYQILFKRHPVLDANKKKSAILMLEFYQAGNIEFKMESWGRSPYLIYVVWWCMQYEEKDRPNITTLLEYLERFQNGQSRIRNKTIRLNIKAKPDIEYLNNLADKKEN